MINRRSLRSRFLVGVLCMGCQGPLACGGETPGGAGAGAAGTIGGGAAGALGGAGGYGQGGSSAGTGGSAGLAGTPAREGGAAGNGAIDAGTSVNDVPEAGGAGGRTGSGGAGGSAGAGGNAGTRGGGDAGAPEGGAAPPSGPDPDTATRMRCTGTDPITCHFGGAPGNYAVTVVLGGAAAGNTVVQAEAHRTVLGATATAAGETKRFSFMVNVREPEGEPIQDVPAGTPGLDLYFMGNMGAAPQLQSIGYAVAPSPFMIYVAGDSTVCDQSSTAYGGWGQMIPQYFDFPAAIANYADSGESSGSFLASANLFGAINSRLRANDWVLIQFGHNDKTVTAASFHDSMTRLVTGVKAKGAFPVLITPVARAQFSGTTVSPQHINGTGANLPMIIKQVATEQSVPVLDLTARTVTWLTELGPQGWQAFHALGTDVTHTNPAGAAVEAGFLRDLIKQANLAPLVAHLR